MINYNILQLYSTEILTPKAVAPSAIAADCSINAEANKPAGPPEVNVSLLTISSKFKPKLKRTFKLEIVLLALVVKSVAIVASANVTISINEVPETVPLLSVV